MIHLSFYRALLIVFLLSTGTIGQTTECVDQEYSNDGRCCKKCPPGTYLKDFCSKTKETDCHPCQIGFYADKYNTFDRCEPCPSCQQGFSVNCTNTTRGNCSCQPGFLCSDDLCSSCVEKCSAGLESDSDQCGPKCAKNHYFDAKQNTCKPWTQCSEKGFVERIPGNATHDAVCGEPANQTDDRDLVYWNMSIGFVLVSLAIFLFVVYACLKILRKNWGKNAARKISVQVVPAKTSDFHLSKEESGFTLLIQDDIKDCSIVSQMDSENISTVV